MRQKTAIFVAPNLTKSYQNSQLICLWGDFGCKYNYPQLSNESANGNRLVKVPSQVIMKMTKVSIFPCHNGTS